MSENSSSVSPSTSFIQAARRGQLVECAIEVIAEVGLARASTVRIARRAGVSRGVLTYHFRDRAELIEQVIARVYELGGEFLLPRMGRAASPRESMMIFIGGSVELYAAHPVHMAALTAIFAAGPTDAGVERARLQRHSQEMLDLSRILHEGQERGQFRDFDVGVMARTIRGALDGAVAHIANGGDVEPYASELQAIFDAATAVAKV
ncbi:MAG: TetR/AcrR family transcriptional regulator [Stackebrandtia sp.]